MSTALCQPLTHCPPWLTRDRFRTMINVLGDALAAGIMAHICRKDFAQDTGTEVRAVPPCWPGPSVEWVELGWEWGQQFLSPAGYLPIPPCLWPWSPHL